MITHINNSSKRYWKHSLWLTVSLALVTLIVMQAFRLHQLTIPLMVSSIFSLVLSFSYSFFWRLIAIKYPDNLTAFYTASSGLRMLLALIVMLVYYLAAGRSLMFPFLVVFMTFYMAMLIYHAIFVSKVTNKI